MPAANKGNAPFHIEYESPRPGRYEPQHVHVLPHLEIIYVKNPSLWMRPEVSRQVNAINTRHTLIPLAVLIAVFAVVLSPMTDSLHGYKWTLILPIIAAFALFAYARKRGNEQIADLLEDNNITPEEYRSFNARDLPPQMHEQLVAIVKSGYIERLHVEGDRRAEDFVSIIWGAIGQGDRVVDASRIDQALRLVGPPPPLVTASRVA